MLVPAHRKMNCSHHLQCLSSTGSMDFTGGYHSLIRLWITVWISSCWLWLTLASWQQAAEQKARKGILVGLGDMSCFT